MGMLWTVLWKPKKRNMQINVNWYLHRRLYKHHSLFAISEDTEHMKRHKGEIRNYLFYIQRVELEIKNITGDEYIFLSFVEPDVLYRTGDRRRYV